MFFGKESNQVQVNELSCLLNLWKILVVCMKNDRFKTKLETYNDAFPSPSGYPLPLPAQASHPNLGALSLFLALFQNAFIPAPNALHVSSPQIFV